MMIKLNLGSYITNEYPYINSKRVQLIGNHRIYTIEDVDKYWGDVLDEYNKQKRIDGVQSKILSIKDKLCQIVKRK